MNEKRVDNIPEPWPLVEVRRGGITESRHRGHVVAVDGDGQIVARLGAPETLTYLRSSAKPFQSLPLVSSGAADHFGFTEQEIAIACASHNGEQIHTETVAGMLRRIRLCRRLCLPMGSPKTALWCARSLVARD
jgi:L-asparaginase II